MGRLSVGVAAAPAVVWILLVGPCAVASGLAVKPEPYAKLQLVDDDCCTECVKKKGKPKVCKTFCGKGSDDQCDDFEDGKIAPLEYQTCYPVCADQCAKTRSSLTWEQCIVDCLNRTRC
jgi:hypothetical protein